MQELIRRRRRAAFVGRQQELRLFRENFDVPPEDERHRFLFCVHGPAGVGKTSLVHELRQAARDRGALVAYVDDAADTLPQVLTEVAAQFARQRQRLKGLERALAGYRQRAREALCARPGDALAEALRDGVDACHAQTRYAAVAREWARVLVAAGEDAGDERLRRWGEDCLAALADEHLGPVRVLDLILARGELDDQGRVAAYNARGWCHFGAGMLTEALDDHARAVDLDPADPWGHHGRAITLRARAGDGDHEAALTHIDRCAELAPGAAWVSHERGETYRRMGRHEDALAELDRAHALAPREPLTLGSRAQVKYVLGRPTEALADFDHALALWPDYTWALTRRAHVRSVLGDTDGALADLDRAERLAPDGSGIQGERGDVLRAAGRHEEAIAAYGRALALDPGYAWALGSRALAHEALGHGDRALADLERALEIDPGYGWARSQRARLLAGGL
ncbi:hypothetical protein GCM10010252_50040 [Streptomyces aureoverticillatus]|nr:hypothetical protein GCM10010252_50040 [Streptomyces aureoverticillatus]